MPAHTACVHWFSKDITIGKAPVIEVTCDYVYGAQLSFSNIQLSCTPLHPVGP